MANVTITTSKRAYAIISAQQLLAFEPTSPCNLPTGIYSLGITFNDYRNPKLPSAQNGRIIYIFLSINTAHTWSKVAQEIQYKINLINNNKITAEITTVSNRFVIKITSDIINTTSRILITSGCTLETANTQFLQQLLQSLGNSFQGDFLNALRKYANYTISIKEDFDFVTTYTSQPIIKQTSIQTYIEEKPLRWESVGALQKLEPRKNKLIEKIATAQKGLNKIDIILQTGDKLLNKTKNYIQLLQTLEQSINRGIYLFLELIINYIQSFVDIIKSTGIYVLDLTTYHIQPDIAFDIIDNITVGLTNDAWWYESDEYYITLDNDIKDLLKTIKTLLQDLQSKYDKGENAEFISSQIKTYILIIDSLLSNKYPQNISDLKNFLKWLNENTYILLTEAKNQGSNIIDTINHLYYIFSYKRETYYEFIDVICNAFSDPYDVPDDNIIKKFNKQKEFEKKSKIYTQDSAILYNSLLPPDKRIVYEPFALEYFRSGRPQFPPGTKVDTVIWALATPNISEFITLYNQFIKLLTQTKDIIKAIPTWHQPQQQLFNIISEAIDVKTLIRSDEPNFYGITLNNLFPELFKSIDIFLEKCKAFSFKTNITSIIEPINDYIIYLQNTILKLRELITIITNISQLVVQIIALLGALRELRISSNNGTIGIIQQLRNADPMTFMPPPIDIKMILKKFNLNGNEPVDIDNTIKSKDFIDEPIDVNMKLQRIHEYATRITQNIAELQQKQILLQSDITLISNCVTFCDTLLSQLQTFLLLLETSTQSQFVNYRDAILTYNTTIQNYESTLQSLQATYDAYINNVYSTTNTSGYKNRKYIDIQIDYYTYELSNESGYNIAYYDEYNKLQNEIDLLDANNSDPNAPSNPNYVAERQVLVNKQIDLTNKKQKRDAELTGLLNTHISAKNKINTFLDSIAIYTINDLQLIQDKIDQLKDELLTLKQQSITEHQNYINTKNAKLAQITTNEQTIQDKYTLISQKQQLINDKNAQIQNITIMQLQPAQQDRETLCPGCDCPLSRIELRPSPPCKLSDPIKRAQMLVIMGKILDAQEAIDALQNEINILNQEITILYQEINTLNAANEQLHIDIQTLDEAIQIYDAEHYLLELEKTLQINALTIWKLAEQTRLTIQSTTVAMNTYKTNQQAIITSMYNTLLRQFVPILYDSNSINCIEYIQQIFNIDIYKANKEIINNILKKLQSLLTILQNDINIINNKIAIFQNIMLKVGNYELRNKKIQELIKLLNAKIFNPNEKMYYAGILFCWSLHPIENIKLYTSNYFNATQAIAELRQQYQLINGQVKTLTGKDLKEIKKAIASIF